MPYMSGAYVCAIFFLTLASAENEKKWIYVLCTAFELQMLKITFYASEYREREKIKKSLRSLLESFCTFIWY